MRFRNPVVGHFDVLCQAEDEKHVTAGDSALNRHPVCLRCGLEFSGAEKRTDVAETGGKDNIAERRDGHRSGGYTKASGGPCAPENGHLRERACGDREDPSLP